LKDLIKLPEFLILLSICFCVVLFKLGFFTFVVSLLVISIVQFFREIDFKWLVFLGKISFSLYLLHTIIGTAIINYLSHFYKRPYEKIFVVILGYSISVLSAWVFYKFIEEPSKKIADRIKY
ncbi:MAG: hypothetical protein ACK452_04810, partial [Bacteroidota bacterium]